MHVILLKDVKGLGKCGDIKDVREGYARNVLLPKNFVQIATPENMKKVVMEKAHQQEKKLKKTAERKKEADEIKKITLTFSVRAGEHGEVFGSVQAKDIQKALLEKGIDAEVELPHPLKKLGEEQVLIDLGEGIKSYVMVKIISFSS